MMQKKDYLSNILKVALTGTFIYVWCLIIFGEEYAWREYSVPNILLVAVLIIGIYIIYKIDKSRAKLHKSWKISKKRENIILIIVSAVMLGLQLVIIWNAGFRTGWDPGAVWYGSHYVAMENQEGIKDMAYYFSVYPNNLLLVFFYSCILNLNELIGNPISNGILLLSMIQCVLITVTGVLLFKVSKRFVSSRWCWLAYGLYFILVGLSGWIMIPYSDSSGIIFPLFLIWLYLKEKESDRMAKKAIYIFLLLAVSMIGFQIKPMALIVLIAIVIIEVLEKARHWKNKWKKQLKEYVIYIIAALAGAGMSALLITCAIRAMQFPVVTETVLGWQHHMMLGLNENSRGGYSQEDFDFSTGFDSKEEQNRAELEMVRTRLKELGVSGYLKLFTRKAEKNYLDGSFGWGGGASFYTEIYPERGNFLCPLLRSLYYDNSEENLFGLYAQFRQFIWLAVLLGAASGGIGKGGLKVKEKVLILSVLGLMLYLQIFEAHPRYLFTYVPLYIVLSVVGYRNLKSRVYNKKYI